MTNEEDIFNGCGVEVTLKDPGDFLKIIETLTRIGIASRDKTLCQSCNVLHKKGRYAIVHFKELFILDGKPSTLDASDLARRNTIVTLLEQWNLLTIVNPKLVGECCPISKIKIVSHKEKSDWKLVSKYPIGKVRRPKSK